MSGLLSKDEMIEKLTAMILLQRSAEFGMQVPLARERSVWVDNNIPTYLQGEVWREAIKRADRDEKAQRSIS